MAKDFPEIEEYTRLMPGGDLNIKIGDKNFRGDQCHFADERSFRFSVSISSLQWFIHVERSYTVVLLKKRQQIFRYR